ncbi:MAG: radical SAM family heme chaperone HemW [Opitutales bacterium]
MQDKNLNLLKNFNTASPKGLYLHVPFCTNKCDYCAFYKKNIGAGDFELYINSLSLEISKYPEFQPTSIFIGGGTPSALSNKYLRQMLEILKSKITSDCVEFSIEVSPSSINAEKLEIMRDFGVNRISMGVQSFDESLLRTLGRHTQLKQIYKAIDTISTANFEHFNLDLIFAMQGETLEQLESDLKKAITYPIDHLSAYCIEYESGTALCAGMNTKDIDENREIEFVEFTSNLLKRNGFERYEISNFAKNGAYCKHNLGTWNMNEWVGLGASAASQYKNMRYKNLQDFNSWAEKLSKGENTFIECEKLDDDEMLLSSIIFGLRLIKGFNYTQAKARFAKANSQKHRATINKLKSEDLLLEEGDTLRLSPKGLILADAIALEFI